MNTLFIRALIAQKCVKCVSFKKCVKCARSNHVKNRLKSVIPIIISSHQTGFQKGKSTTDNLILMYLVLEYYERNPQEEGYLVQIDFEKAFDSVEHQYIYV